MADTSTEKRKKLNLMMSQKSYDELALLTKQRGDTISRALRIGLSLYKVLVEAEAEDEKIFVVSADEQSEREVIVPRTAASGN